MNTKNIPTGLGKALSQCVTGHGHALQHALTNRLAVDVQSGWKVVTIEHPVKVLEAETKIDLVLVNPSLRVALVVEFKRPRAGAYWAFFHIPHASLREGCGVLTITRLYLNSTGHEGYQNIALLLDSLGSRVAHLGLQVITPRNKDDERDIGDAERGSGPIEKAAGQASLAHSGFLLSLTRSSSFDRDRNDWIVLPMVVTTAQLISCIHSICDADVSNGTIHIQDSQIKNEDYMILQYPVSLSRSLSPMTARAPQDLGAVREVELNKSVLIVNSDCVQKLLREFPWHSLRDGLEKAGGTDLCM